MSMKYGEIIRDVKTRRMEDAVTCAAEMYLKNGISDTKMTDIADACQLGVASLYRYFGTKQAFTIKAACHIWQQQYAKINQLRREEDFQSETGIRQVQRLMDIFPALLREHSPFLRFLSDFDAFVTRERLTHEDLLEYENSVMNVLSMMESTIEKGIQDGTIRPGVDAKLYETTVGHSLMSMCQKFSRGKVLSSDDPAMNLRELDAAIEMYLAYIRT